MDDNPIQSVRIEFENGVERDTSISFFIEKALEDDDATVYRSDTDEEVTSIEEVTGEAATA